MVILLSVAKMLVVINAAKLQLIYQKPPTQQHL